MKQLPKITGLDIIMTLLVELFSLSSYRRGWEEESDFMAFSEKIGVALNELHVQLRARRREEFGLSPEEEEDLCNRLLQVNLYHFNNIRYFILDFVEHRLVLVQGASMTMAEAIDFVQLVVGTAPEALGWTMTWEAHISESKRALSNATIQNGAAREAQQWEDQQNALEMAEVMRAPND